MTFGMIPCKCGNKPNLEMNVVKGMAETKIQCSKCERAVICIDEFTEISIAQTVKMWNEYNVADISTSLEEMDEC